MGKKAARQQVTHLEEVRQHQEFLETRFLENGERSAGGAWDPLATVDRQRDRRYVRHVRPMSDNQRLLMEAVAEHSLTFAIGPAGTGKTYLAIAQAVEALEKGAVGRIVLTRPAVEAGENLGFLPGALEDKLDPYLRPLFDALGERLGGKRLRQLMGDGTIEIAPVAYMRGRTLNNAFIVVDEAQNCTYQQIKMLLTRLGWHSTMVVTGDPEQTDLLPELSGLAEIAGRLDALERIAVVRMTREDVVRHPLVGEMLEVL
ncbi:MAG: PhoH family protein [Alphaproteobacteria bacterium]|nr:PhoH family protein [Alphaproteobacteria bacterium]MCB9928678.1 PhoH family protein [Alphaproteobacteria bacterium]